MAARYKTDRAGEFHLKILITSAEGEQAPTDPIRMIDNASELADRLKPLNSATVQVQRVISPGEIHVTVSQASLTRALRFALSLASRFKADRSLVNSTGHFAC